MITLQKSGALAAFVAAATYLFGFGFLLGSLIPAGYDIEHTNLAQDMAFLSAQSGGLFLWNFIIYILNGVALAILVVTLHERLVSVEPHLAHTAYVFGLIWTGLVIASGMVGNVGMQQSLAIFGEDPDAAATLLSAVITVRDGLGGGNELVGGLWVLLLSLAALRSDTLSKPLNYLGIVIGVAGIVTLVPGLSDIGAIFGLGFIAWFIWVGIVLLQAPQN